MERTNQLSNVEQGASDFESIGSKATLENCTEKHGHSSSSESGVVPSLDSKPEAKTGGSNPNLDDPPPDGGWTAWSQCIALHAVGCNSWGMANSFGTFQTYYMTLLPDRSASDISFIGTLPIFLMFFCASITGRLTDAGYFRTVFVIGSIFQILGSVSLSFCSTYWQLMLAQGLSVGIANGFLFCPSFTITSTYFLKKRSIAVGIGACGSVTGGIVFPLMARQLLPKIGFPWTMRAIALVQLFLLLVANVLSKPRVKPRKGGPLIDIKAFKEMEYTFYALGAFLIFWGVYFGFFYLASFARNALQSPFQFEDSLNLLLITNGVGFLGRIIPNYLADRTGAVTMLIPVSSATAILVFCWMSVNSSSGLYAWSVFYGFFAGGIQSLFPAALSLLSDDMSKIGVRTGMVFTVVSFAVLTGSPIAGSIIDKSGNYKGAQGFAGASLAMGSAFLLASKIVRMRKTGRGWLGKV
ncbi:unnamed protein product [Clonostachys rosea f. rosea IK726]|uniref:Major facilitator superfamily (MFS) profile domain-containing protein n=2 Tax=Bionectria ochroleuca TaxID=29856 RepID=A0A0B7KH24_BIOOC|nr:unnamed protein product [Clonostachys rosea f. rosea IK726]